MRMTPAKLRAQRANARLGRGPRTKEGRRRSALNGRLIKLQAFTLEGMRRRGKDPKELQRLWRDLLALFWFAEPPLGVLLEMLAWEWWRKLEMVRDGKVEAAQQQDGEIERELAGYVRRFRWMDEKWSYWLRKRFGTDCATDMRRLRECLESRLALFRQIQTPPPPFSPLSAAVNPKLQAVELTDVRTTSA